MIILPGELHIEHEQQEGYPGKGQGDDAEAYDMHIGVFWVFNCKCQITFLFNLAYRLWRAMLACPTTS